MNSLNKLRPLNNCVNKQFTLNKVQKKFLNKSFRPSMYNLRLYYSNMRRSEHGYGRWDMVYGPDGMDKTQTDRNPENFKYKSNLVHHTIYELRHIYGDALYQMFLRRHRLADPFGKYILPTATIATYLLSGQHFVFLVSFKNLLIIILFIIYHNSRVLSFLHSLVVLVEFFQKLKNLN